MDSNRFQVSAQPPLAAELASLIEEENPNRGNPDRANDDLFPEELKKYRYPYLTRRFLSIFFLKPDTSISPDT